MRLLPLRNEQKSSEVQVMHTERVFSLVRQLVLTLLPLDDFRRFITNATKPNDTFFFNRLIWVGIRKV